MSCFCLNNVSMCSFSQWFGNMVTMKWWSDLWLNEGFASILMYFGMDNGYPGWNVVSKVCEYCLSYQEQSEFNVLTAMDRDKWLFNSLVFYIVVVEKCFSIGLTLPCALA